MQKYSGKTNKNKSRWTAENRTKAENKWLHAHKFDLENVNSSCSSASNG